MALFTKLLLGSALAVTAAAVASRVCLVDGPGHTSRGAGPAPAGNAPVVQPVAAAQSDAQAKAPAPGPRPLQRPAP